MLEGIVYFTKLVWLLLLRIPFHNICSFSIWQLCDSLYGEFVNESINDLTTPSQYNKGPWGEERRLYSQLGNPVIIGISVKNYLRKTAKWSQTDKLLSVALVTLNYCVLVTMTLWFLRNASVLSTWKYKEETEESSRDIFNHFKMITFDGPASRSNTASTVFPGNGVLS